LLASIGDTMSDTIKMLLAITAIAVMAVVTVSYLGLFWGIFVIGIGLAPTPKFFD
jgi:hypothetical protein